MGKCKAIQTDVGTFEQNQAYSKPCVNLAYLEPWYIQNISHKGVGDREFLIYLLIYSNKLAYCS